jgi:hypothetical protein
MRPETRLHELLKPKRKKPPERMLIAYSDSDICFIMCRRGPGIEEEDASLPLDELGCGVEPGPAEGLWVYDVTPKFVPDYVEGYPTDYGSLEYDKGTFRRPTEEEWKLIHNGNMEGLFELWSDVVSSEQWSEMLKKDEEEAKKP